MWSHRAMSGLVGSPSQSARIGAHEDVIFNLRGCDVAVEAQEISPLEIGSYSRCLPPSKVHM